MSDWRRRRRRGWGTCRLIHFHRLRRKQAATSTAAANTTIRLITTNPLGSALPAASATDRTSRVDTAICLCFPQRRCPSAS